MAISEQDSKNRDEIKEQLINVRRVAKVVKGGRIFGFSALTVVGDGAGRVGIGIGKAREVPVAAQKSFENARRNMVRIHLKNGTLQYPIIGRHGAAKVVMRPASAGTGIIAGDTMRLIFEMAGVRDVLAKVVGTTNAINVARATIDGLTSIRSPQEIADKRSKNVYAIF
ncbi:MAG: 30S ribosomal protein S5 [Acidiferrobacterales bacterium]|nr:30S ribosomal protein S5 [Acidiferrobacterales bacterium]